MDNVERLNGVSIFHSGTTIRDDQLVTSGGRVLGITSLGDNIEEAASKAYEAVNLINFEGAHFRRDIAQKANVIIAGGHTINDSEPKYGLAVIGNINPNNVMKVTNAKPNQDLIITKPIGNGIITTAAKSISLELDIPFISIVTTYSGSETTALQ